jgi:hypothetical protein
MAPRYGLASCHLGAQRTMAKPGHLDTTAFGTLTRLIPKQSEYPARGINTASTEKASIRLTATRPIEKGPP